MSGSNMASEAKSREEIQRFRALLEEMRAAEASPQESSSTVLLVVKAARGKDDDCFSLRTWVLTTGWTTSK